MKVLVSRVTSVRRNFFPSLNYKEHLLRHEDVKPYVCAECSKRFCTGHELKLHQPVHSDYRQFICVLCNRLFKRKGAVKNHFKKCSTLWELDYNFPCFGGN